MRRLGLAIAWAFALGCASRESPLRPDTGVVADVGEETAVSKLPPGAEAALAKNHAVYCRSFRACFPVHFANFYTDETTCIARRLQASVAGLFGPGSLLTTADVEACGRANGETATCDEVLRQFYENPVVPADCRLRGELANGAACAGSDQCKSGYCKYPPNASCGSCTDRAAPGGACTNHVDCAEGFACADGACVAFVERGGACDAKKPCHTVDVCNAGRCVQRLSTNSACDDTLQDCEIALTCSRVSKTCVAVESHGLGSPCGYLATGGLGLCDPSLKCKITNTAEYTGACVGAANEGESCFRTGPTGPQCVTPLRCANLTCVLPSTDTCR